MRKCVALPLCLRTAKLSGAKVAYNIKYYCYYDLETVIPQPSCSYSIIFRSSSSTPRGRNAVS